MSLHNEDISHGDIARNILLQNRQNNWKISIPEKSDIG
jgi:tRNA A-37 threonylcarbamoyl transferase component Bud32